MSKFKIIQPHSVLIEKTAGEYAAIFWEACRSSGMKQGKHKNARSYARANLEKFIPLVVKNLIDIMSRPETPVEMKETIYQAILERTNDEQLAAMGTQAGLPEFQNTPLFKKDDEKPKPIIINTPAIDFNFNARKSVMAKKLRMPVESVSASTAPQAIISKRSHEDEARERKYRAEDALRDIERAEGHKRDKALMKDVKSCAKEKMKAYGKL